MTTPKKPLSKNESAIQLGNILKYGAGAGGRGGASRGLIKNLKKLLKIKPKTIKSQESLTRAGKDLKLKKAGSLKFQKKGAK